MAIKNDLILKMTPEIRSKNFQKCSKARYHLGLSCQFYIICDLDPLAACAELFQAHVCCLSSTSKLSITVNENTPDARSVKSVKATIKSFIKINMEKLNYVIGKDVSRLSPKFRNI